MQKPSPLATFIFCTSRWRGTRTHTHTHARGSWKWKQPESRSSRRTRRLSSQLCTPNRIVREPSRAILAVQHLNTDKFKTGRLFGPVVELRRASGTIGEQKRWAAPLPARSREASWPPEPFRVETPQACLSCSGEEVQLVIVVRERFKCVVECLWSWQQTNLGKSVVFQM